MASSQHRAFRWLRATLIAGGALLSMGFLTLWLYLEFLPTQAFQTLDGITEARVHLDALSIGEANHRIVDPNAVAALIDFINEERSGWGGKNIVLGIPVPDVKVALYDGSAFKGHFGVGRKACASDQGFFETSLVPPFSAKPASSARCAEFLALIGLGQNS